MATTTTRIQEIAGVSRGSVLHQFPSRDTLLVAAVQYLADRREGGLELDDDLVPVDDLDEAVTVMWSTFHGPLFRAALQLWVNAEHNPDLAAALRPAEGALGQRNRARIVRLFGERYASHEGFADLISLLHNAMRGVALTYAFAAHDPATDPHLPAWRRIARSMLGES
ncbi:hypothetical protein ASD43_01610 [Microbacterium sp. Root553]|nr:hypothetical protein ASD43_01610 [Microbacterium sp. Root553]